MVVSDAIGRHGERMADTDKEVWEPGPPSLAAMRSSLIPGAVIPLAVYYSIRNDVSTANALIISGSIPALWVGYEWLRTRRLDPIPAITLFGFVVGVIVSELMGGNAFVLKVRDSAFTVLFGLTCLASLRWKRPLMFHIGKAMSAGDDRDRQAAYDELYEMPSAPRTFAIITIVWGLGLICEAGVRVLLAAVMPTGAFLAVSPVLFGIVFAGLFAFTVRYSARVRTRTEAEYADDDTINYPSVPAAVPAAEQAG